MKCEYCENEVPFGVNRCPSCGASVSMASAIDVATASTMKAAAVADNITRRMENFQFDEPVGLKNKWCFILLGVFFGAFGIHNFYTGYISRGFVKLLLTVFSGMMLAWVSWIWAIVEVCTVRRDSDGRPFESGSL